MRVLGILLAFASVSLADTITFSDTEFATSDWSQAEVRDTGGNGSLTVSQGTVLGNPGNYRAGRHDWGPGLVGYAHVYDPAAGASVDPSLGAISTIDLDLDVRVFDNTSGFNGAVRWYFMIEQGGTYYGVGDIVAFKNDGAWAPFSGTGLTASDFLEISSSSNIADPLLVAGSTPDFSTSGGEVTFGFASMNGASTNFFTEWGVDNWSVTINTETIGTAPIPEPGTYALFSAALIGYGLYRGRRKCT